MDQLRWLANRGIELHTQLVIVPEFNDGHWLERSIRELAELWPAVRSISVVPVGLTKHHKYRMRTHTKQEAAAILDYVTTIQPEYLDSFGIRFVYPTDEWYLVAGREIPPLEAYDGQELHENGLGMVRHFLDEWEAVKYEVSSYQKSIDRRKTFTLVTGSLFGPTLHRAVTEFAGLTGAEVTVQPITNERLGHTISAAGLLMGDDIVNQLGSSGYGDMVILPRVVFDHPETISLDDLSPQDIAGRLGRPVALADTMGDVWDALIGQSQVMYRPVFPHGE
jgi:putative radical SAM enzyme (TIGR03279 family)